MYLTYELLRLLNPKPIKLYYFKVMTKRLFIGYIYLKYKVFYNVDL